MNLKVIDQWQKWIDEVYCSRVSALLLAQDCEIFEVIGLNEDENKTFSVQWRCNDLKSLEDIKVISEQSCGELMAAFGDKCLYFSSILEKYK